MSPIQTVHHHAAHCGECQLIARFGRGATGTTFCSVYQTLVLMLLNTAQLAEEPISC